MTNSSKDVKLLPLVLRIAYYLTTSHPQLRLSLAYCLLYIHTQSRWPYEQLFMGSVLLMSTVYMVLHSSKLLFPALLFISKAHNYQDVK